MIQRPDFRYFQHWLVFLLACGFVFGGTISTHAASPSNVKVESSVTIVESENEPAPVRRATEDLLSDFGKVFGQTPSLANHMEGSGQVAILISGPQRPYAGIKCTEPTGGAESFAFSVVHLAGRGQVRDVICLAGADMRGTIYAIYQFSQTVLGIDPMYLWTDKQPEKRSSITLPADFAQVYPKPVFRYRGFFPNDEDLLTGWIPAAQGRAHGNLAEGVGQHLRDHPAAEGKHDCAGNVDLPR